MRLVCNKLTKRSAKNLISIYKNNPKICLTLYLVPKSYFLRTRRLSNGKLSPHTVQIADSRFELNSFKYGKLIRTKHCYKDYIHHSHFNLDELKAVLSEAMTHNSDTAQIYYLRNDWANVP